MLLLCNSSTKKCLTLSNKCTITIVHELEGCLVSSGVNKAHGDFWEDMHPNY